MVAILSVIADICSSIAIAMMGKNTDGKEHEKPLSK